MSSSPITLEVPKGKTFAELDAEFKMLQKQTEKDIKALRRKDIPQKRTFGAVVVSFVLGDTK